MLRYREPTKTDDKSSDRELGQVKSHSLKECSKAEDCTSGPDGHLSSKAIGSKSCRDSAYQSAAGGERSDKLGFARGKLMAK